MPSDKGWYWVVVGVVALGVSNGFANGHGDWARRLTDRSVAVADQASGVAMRYAGMAEMALGRGNAGFDRTQMAVVRAQTRLACIQTAMARHEATLARVQAERIRVQVLEHLPRAAVCPRSNLVIEAPEPPQTPKDGTI